MSVFQPLHPLSLNIQGVKVALILWLSTFEAFHGCGGRRLRGRQLAYWHKQRGRERGGARGEARNRVSTIFFVELPEIFVETRFLKSWWGARNRVSTIFFVELPEIFVETRFLSLLRKCLNITQKYD
ncbi:MAG: hypothetical protein EAZ39_26435 [Oscillatoriales cyanobacterium]|nr:MAG: hypothetical protein EAZ86_13800 [Oscillatoriales cyanobacterium]TAG04600.1 MAG: hypothetical protein EAZ45_07510 [Oscillatoriales cyanobacterium]TAG13938.1 MAG: hypothetical protein EAZ39_26435 [Oscillatoriales cyanobacterium]TAG41896.1 MAG: hypothetical protein EAZ33_16195 [Oscillatoriales cyanobacterium]TAG58971.1 MAG: hypothetical protein EAZ28_13220 [Oscillatoriales cyanobacterium]